MRGKERERMLGIKGKEKECVLSQIAVQDSLAWIWADAGIHGKVMDNEEREKNTKKRLEIRKI